METVKPGSQVYIHYGDRTNAELLLYSGFYYPSNSTKVQIPISISLPKSHAHFKAVSEILTTLGCKVYVSYPSLSIRLTKLQETTRVPSRLSKVQQRSHR